MESSQSMPEKAPDEVAIQIWTGHQERSSEHERQRLEFTSVVVGASLVAIGLLAEGSSDGTPEVTAALALVAMINVLAIAYSWRGNQWARWHRDVARALATDRWPDLVAFASTVKRPHDRAHLIGRELLQRTLHLVVALAAIVLIVAG